MRPGSGAYLMPQRGMFKGENSHTCAARRCFARRKALKDPPPASRLQPVSAMVRRTKPIARRPHNAPPQRDTGPRVNDRIRAPEIRLIGADGENAGVVHPAKCKIMDFGKFKYEQQKRESEARKKQKVIEVKEVKFRPNTDTHDYGVKMRNVFKFLENGDKVKVTLRFRGREMAHQNLGRELLLRVAEDIKELGKVENMPKMEGRQMIMMIGPLPQK